MPDWHSCSAHEKNKRLQAALSASPTTTEAMAVEGGAAAAGTAASAPPPAWRWVVLLAFCFNTAIDLTCSCRDSSGRSSQQPDIEGGQHDSTRLCAAE